jgi:hypothetical protein
VEKDSPEMTNVSACPPEFQEPAYSEDFCPKFFPQSMLPESFLTFLPEWKLGFWRWA